MIEYERAKLSIVTFDTDDVVTTSPGENGDNDMDAPGGGGNDGGIFG